MNDFFKGVRRHIDKLDADHLREQYARLSEEALSLDTLFQTIAQGIVVLDEHGVVLKSNPAARELLGMNPAEALPTLAIPLGKSSKRELLVTYPVERTLEVQTVPMPAGSLVYLRDITAEKARTEEELRAGATQAVRDLAAGVAHEIGNPLNALALNLQLLQRTYKDEEGLAECLSQVKRLDGILKGFLQALRPSKPNLTVGSVAQPVKDCLATLKAQFEERRIRVGLNLPGALPPVAIDKDQIQQVLFNLIKNALEAMKDGGALELDIGSDDNDIILKITDDGLGMAPEQVAHLFEPYRTTKSHGTGLGLMITARIIHDHGGTIDVESQVGEGTTFTVRLPRLERRTRALN